MNKDTYDLIENYMLSCTEDSAHDKEHVCYMTSEEKSSLKIRNYVTQWWVEIRHIDFY